MTAQLKQCDLIVWKNKQNKISVSNSSNCLNRLAVTLLFITWRGVAKLFEKEGEAGQN